MSPSSGAAPHRGPASPGAPGPTTTRSFRPGPGFLVLVGAVSLVILLALGAAVTGALGARGASSIMGGLALVIVGAGLLAALRVPARAVVVNAPRLRLDRGLARMRAAGRATGSDPGTTGRSRADGRVRGAQGATASGAGAGAGAGTRGGSAAGGQQRRHDELARLDAAAAGARALTVRELAPGPGTALLASTGLGRAAEERLAGTTTGETLVRVLQLLAGALGFLLLALGLASVLGQVLR